MRIGMLAALMLAASVRSQEVPPFPQAYALTTDRTLNEKFREARTFIQVEDWSEAVRLLQSVLEIPEDAFVPVPRKEGLAWGSARKEAMQLLQELPKAGREFYQSTHGPRAAALLAQAKNRPEALEEAARLFPLTEAGMEAARLLGIAHLDRGRPELAARYFAPALDEGRMKSWDAARLLPPLMAFHRTGDRDRFARAWGLLSAAAPEGVMLGQRNVSLDDLKKQLGPLGPRQENPLERLAGFKHLAALPISAIDDGWWHQTVRKLEEEGQPVLPQLFPALGQDRVFFRTLRGIAAADLDGKWLWESASGISLDALASDTASYSHVNTWIQNTRKTNPHLLLDHAVLGTLSAGGRFVHAIEDLPLPAYPENFFGFRGTSTTYRLAFAPYLTDAIYHSRLLTLEAESGKVIWELGGRGMGRFDDTFFLSPPLVVANRLYVIVEKDQELKLLCLDSATGKQHWVQRLGLPKNKLLLDGGRRSHGASLVYVDGRLLCMTNAGAILCFDLLSQSFRWATFYHKETPPAPPPPMVGGRVRPIPAVGSNVPPHMKPFWRLARPFVMGDRIVLPSPDEATLVCLNLSDGTTLWRAAASEDDLFGAAVHRELVLIAGKTHVRALNLDDGKERWKLPSGMPGGMGVLQGDRYVLPLRAENEKKPALLLHLDLAKGMELERTELPRGETGGHLILHGNRVLMQSAKGLSFWNR